MHSLYGILVAAIGLFILVSATLRSDSIVYQLLVARSRGLWGNHVHRFHQVVGLILAALGLLWAGGLIWTEA